MSTVFMGAIIMFGGNFAPRGWAFCSGQILPIAQNTALFSLLGTTYGGNGQTTFALPDLRSRVPINMGQGPGLSNYQLGQQAGTETVTVLTSNLPAHVHALQGVPGSTARGDTSSPTNAVPATLSSRSEMPYTSTAANTNMTAGINTGITGNNVPLAIMPPYLAVNFIIAIEGIFPARN